jgi:hypothetical protein
MVDQYELQRLIERMEKAKREAEEKITTLQHYRFGLALVMGLLSIGLLLTICFLGPAYFRYQARMNSSNTVLVNEIIIKQTEQLVQVEKQKAQVRLAEAEGIAAAQKTINATLTDRYLQHEAIMAQERMAGSPNHTQIYVPVGTNGIPLVRTVNPEDEGGDHARNGNR